MAPYILEDIINELMDSDAGALSPGVNGLEAVEFGLDESAAATAVTPGMSLLCVVLELTAFFLRQLRPYRRTMMRLSRHLMIQLLLSY